MQFIKNFDSISTFTTCCWKSSVRLQGCSPLMYTAMCMLALHALLEDCSIPPACLLLQHDMPTQCMAYSAIQTFGRVQLQLTTHRGSKQFSLAATLCKVWLLTTCARTIHDKHTHPHQRLPLAMPLFCLHARLYHRSRDRARPARMHDRPHTACKGVLIQQHFRSAAVR
jgi:hypothetical protein